MAKTFQPIRKVEQERKKESPFAASMRNRKKTGVRWNDTNPEWLRYAAAACTQNNATLVLAPAMGGIGVTIRVWKGEDKWVEYANSPDEFDGWMEAIGDYYASGSEDLRLVLGLPGGGAEEEVADD